MFYSKYIMQKYYAQDFALILCYIRIKVLWLIDNSEPEKLR